MVSISQLVFIFNLSLTKSIFPTDWKKATIVPSFKNGNKKIVSNYRPASLLPLAGKLLEKIVHKGITNHIENSELLSNKQGGFRKDFSTVKSILNLSEDIFENMNNGLVTAAVPSFKNGNKKIVSNYRPVSLLPLAGKLLEKIVHKGITNHIENSELLSNKQGGFRKDFSTVKSILNLSEDIFENMNNGLVTAAVPSFKNGNKKIVSNYRPVSLLPLAGKLLEKIVHKGITNHIENSELLSNKQGFRKDFSTVKSILNLSEDIFENMNNGLVTAAVFIDLKKAFDTVDHLIL